MIKLNFEIDKETLDRQIERVLEYKLADRIEDYIDEIWDSDEFIEKFDKQIFKMLDEIFIENKEYYKNKLEEVIKKDIEETLSDSINEYFRK